MKKRKPEWTKYPLRKILGLSNRPVNFSGENDWFDRDKVDLECGHVVSSNGNQKARCYVCYKEEQTGKKAPPRFYWDKYKP